MNDNNIAELQKGSDYWNLWRKQNPELRPALRDVNFTSDIPNEFRYFNLPSFENTDFSNCDLHGVVLRNGNYINCTFDRSDINWADFIDAYFEHCSFRNVSMRVSKIGSANFYNCFFESSDLSYCSAEDASFVGSVFLNTRLEHMSLVKCNFENTKIENCYVYGTATWDLNLTNSIQENIIITNDENDIISVDNLELAQFIYLLINNSKLRDVIETITSKVVLILGNFSKDRKEILDHLRAELRKYNYIPLMFDFDKPSTRNLTETIIILASMSKFIIADLSSPRSLPHELAVLIPRMQSIPVYPIIKKNEKPYGMFEDFYSYKSVKQIKEYSNDNLNEILIEIVKNNEE